MPGPESIIKNWVRYTLRNHLPGVYIANIHQSMYSHKGIPDLLVCCKGLFIGIEVKTDTGKTSKLQEIELQKIEEADGITMVIYGKDKDKLFKLIDILQKYETPRLKLAE